MNLEHIEVKKETNIIFMGTPMFSVPVLQGLLKYYKIRAVVTQPDRRSGRDGKIVFSPIKQVALKHTLLVIQPENIKEAVDEILSLEPDLIITCAYGQILPRAILDYPKYGCINVHASLLPAFRGGAPIHRSIMAGCKKTGVTIMHMSPRMDEGDIISQYEVEITDTETASSLHDKLCIVGRDLLLHTLPAILKGNAPRRKQNDMEASYAFNITRKDERIDFNKTKRQIYNQVRGLNSFPGAYCLFENRILKVWECYTTTNQFPMAFNGQVTSLYREGFGVKVGNGEVVFTLVQPEGKSKMSGADFVRGFSNKESLVGKMLN